MAQSNRPPTAPAQRRLLAALARRREELQARIEERRTALERAMAANESPGDQADLAFVRMNASVDRELIDRYSIEIGEIERMCMRVADGSFGICSDCGDAIGWNRLKANPVARRCTDCQALHEKHPLRSIQALAH